MLKRMLKREALRAALPLLGVALLAGHAWLAGLFVLVVAWPAVYFAALAARPMITCWRCGGKQTSAVRGREFRWCPVCLAKGFKLKWGVRRLQPHRAAKIAAKIGLPAERAHETSMRG